MPGKTASRGSAVFLIPLSVLVVFAVVTGYLIWAAGGDRGGADAGVEREADRLRAEFAARDARQVGELTETARRARNELTPALEGMATTLPAEGAPSGRVEPAGKVARWSSAVRQASERFANPPSGETATNVARASLGSAVDILESSVRTYELAGGLEGEERVRVLERAATQRDLAVRVWSVGATQLDAVNVESGNGHQHVYLPAAGVTGAFGADSAPEGSGAHKE